MSEESSDVISSKSSSFRGNRDGDIGFVEQFLSSVKDSVKAWWDTVAKGILRRAVVAVDWWEDVS